MLGIAGLFGKDAEYALHGISYANALLYSKAMPMYGDGEDAEAGAAPLYDESKDACEDGDICDTDGYEEETII